MPCIRRLRSELSPLNKKRGAEQFLHSFFICLFKAFCRQERQEHNGVLHGGRCHIAPADDLIGNIRRTAPDQNHIVVEIMQQYRHPYIFAALLISKGEKYPQRHADDELQHDALQ